jgi:hypothetical protein
MKKTIAALALSAAVVTSFSAAQANPRTHTPVASQQIHIDDAVHTAFPQRGRGM